MDKIKLVSDIIWHIVVGASLFVIALSSAIDKGWI